MSARRKVTATEAEIRRRLAVDVHATHRLTQAALAKELGISESRMSQIANDYDEKRRVKRGAKKRTPAHVRKEPTWSMRKAERKALYKTLSAMDKAGELVKDGLIDYEIFREELVKRGEHGKAYALVLQSLPLVEAATKIEALKEKVSNNFTAFILQLTPDKIPERIRDNLEVECLKGLMGIVEELVPGAVPWDKVSERAGIHAGRRGVSKGVGEAREVRLLPGKDGVYRPETGGM